MSAPRKLLSFHGQTDKTPLCKQGHFNDFIEVGLLRSALYKAVAILLGSTGIISHESASRNVFFFSGAGSSDLINMPKDPSIRFQALKDTQKRASEPMLGYRPLPRSLKTGGGAASLSSRIFEQCGPA